MTSDRDSSAGPYSHLEGLPFALAVLRDFQLVYANAALLRLVGFTLEQVVGKTSELFGPEHGALATERHARRQRGEPVPDTYETVLRTTTGERRVELTISPQGADTFVLVRDLAGRMLQRQLLQRMASLGTSLPSLHSEEEVLRRVFEGLAELELSYGYIVPDSERVWLGHVYLAPRAAAGRARLAGQHLVDFSCRWTPLVERAWKEGGAYVEDLGPEAVHFVSPEWSGPVGEHLRGVGALPAICVRIDWEHEPRALLVVAADWLREEELPPVRLFAAQMSAALEAASTISRLSTRNTALSALNQLASVAATASEPRTFYGPGMAEIFGLLHCASAFLLLHTEGSHELELAWHEGTSPETVEGFRRMPLEGSVSQKVMEAGEPRMVKTEDFSEPVRTALRQRGRVCVAMVPLRMRSRMVGMLVITFNDHRTLSVLEQETLQAMSVHFAATLESHRLLREVRGRAEELTRLHSELERTQRQLVERERLAALGELSAIVAHEVRNPLGAIFNAVATLRRMFEPESDAALPLVNILAEEADRLNRLVDGPARLRPPARAPSASPCPWRAAPGRGGRGLGGQQGSPRSGAGALEVDSAGGAAWTGG